MFSGAIVRPDWYHRVTDLVRDRFAREEATLWDEDSQTRPEDYDEDLSDCSTFSCASRNGSDYGSDAICE
ncbi:Uncharacterized protein HZ326_9421 [Fusarium oxysporum f. sp. albedinis]|nr:Uncharacterized protein HZ326_9421 [Fusarium oxysporum f. sp. albedinis]KAK2473178.1 hypothetical protein H9L39_15353 [Fusarium oxysporum f. sp. albedinis]